MIFIYKKKIKTKTSTSIHHINLMVCGCVCVCWTSMTSLFSSHYFIRNTVIFVHFVFDFNSSDYFVLRFRSRSRLRSRIRRYRCWCIIIVTFDLCIWFAISTENKREKHRLIINWRSILWKGRKWTALNHKLMEKWLDYFYYKLQFYYFHLIQCKTYIYN